MRWMVGGNGDWLTGRSFDVFNKPARLSQVIKCVKMSTGEKGGGGGGVDRERERRVGGGQ